MKLTATLSDHKIWGGLATFFTLFILVGSLMPLDKMPKTSIADVDKIIHLGCYFVLTNLWLLFLYFKNQAGELRGSKNLIVLLAIFAFGIFIEVLQGNLTNYRTFDIWDILANTLGILIAWALFKPIKNSLLKI